MFKRILVAIDASDYSQLILPAAIEVASKFGSTVFVLHVAEHDHGRAVSYSLESPADATRVVGNGVKMIRDAGIEVKGAVHDVAVGHVSRDIVNTAAAVEADLIVMGSRGLSDVQGILLGSVTHRVMHLAQLPVLVVRGPIPERARAEEPKGAPAFANA